MGKDKDLIRTQYAEQKENQQAQNEWQSGENVIDRQWQEAFWMRQFASEVEQQNAMFEKETERWLQQQEYNSPKNQVARLMAAGINPSAMASSISPMGGTGSASSGASSPSPSTPSGHSVSPLGLSAPSIGSADAALFSSIAQLQDSMTKLAGSGIEGAKTASTIKPIIDNTVADTQSKQEQAAFTALQRSILDVYGENEAAARIYQSVASAYAAFARGDSDKAQKLYNDALTEFTSNRTFQEKEQFPQVLSNLQKTGELIGAQTTEARAAAKRNVSQAALASEQAQTESVTRGERLTQLELGNEIQRINNELKGRENVRDVLTNQAQIDKVLFSAKEQQLLTEQQIQAIQKAIKDNNSYDVKLWFGILSQMLPNVSFVSPVK